MIFYKQPLILTLVSLLVIGFSHCLPKYCECIQSEGNPFSAFAEYFLKDGKLTKFWWYQNQHKCQMFVKNQREIVFETSGKIEKTDKVYRQWFGYYLKKGNDYEVIECRNNEDYEPTLGNKIRVYCRKGENLFLSKQLLDSTKFSFNTSITFVDGYEGVLFGGKVMFVINQYIENRFWKRQKIRLDWNDNQFVSAEHISEFRDPVIAEIDNKTYINAILDAYDAKHRSNGIFIFVTHEGLPKYCYKPSSSVTSDSCKLKNMRPFMSECNITYRNPNYTINNTETNGTEPEPDNIYIIVFIVILIIILFIIIICLSVYIFWLLFYSSKKDMTQSEKPMITKTLPEKDFKGKVSNVSTISKAMNAKPVVKNT